MSCCNVAAASSIVELNMFITNRRDFLFQIIPEDLESRDLCSYWGCDSCVEVFLRFVLTIFRCGKSFTSVPQLGISQYQE